MMPDRFELEYQGADNANHRPVMIHRALLGSMERFAGILIEHHAGRFPHWLAPTQAIVLPVADRHNEAAAALLAELEDAGVRARVDERSESVGRKIRDAELAKVPFMLVLGDREAEAGGAAVRSHADGDLGVLSAEELVSRVAEPGNAVRARRRSGSATWDFVSILRIDASQPDHVAPLSARALAPLLVPTILR